MRIPRQGEIGKCRECGRLCRIDGKGLCKKHYRDKSVSDKYPRTPRGRKEYIPPKSYIERMKRELKERHMRWMRGEEE